MIPFRYHQWLVTALMTIGVSMAIIGSPANAASWLSSDSYLKATQALANHNYGTAQATLLKLRQQHPENPRIVLDLAMIAHQLHRPNEFSHWQGELQQHFPNSLEAHWVANLGQQPIGTDAYVMEAVPTLPAIAVDDSSNAENNYHYEWEAPKAPAAPVTPTAPNANSNQPNSTIDPAVMQQMMLLQMMNGMGNTNNNQNNGFNPTALMMPQFMQQGNQPGQQTVDPEALSQMMMNQMMSGMDFGFSSKNDR